MQSYICHLGALQLDIYTWARSIVQKYLDPDKESKHSWILGKGTFH